MSGFDKNRDWEGNEEEYIQACLEWLARRKAWVDQKQKMFDDQYPMLHPDSNRSRYEDLDAWQLEIEVNEYELGGFIKDYLDKENS